MVFVTTESNPNWLIDNRVIGNEFVLNFVFREYNKRFPRRKFEELCLKIEMREDYPEARARRIITPEDYIVNNLAVPDYHIYLLGDTIFWCRTIYQFSHEMCHVAMDCYPQNRKFIWLSECFAEAASDYILSLSENFFMGIGRKKHAMDTKDYFDKHIADSLSYSNEPIRQFCAARLPDLEYDPYGNEDGKRRRNNYIGAHLYKIIADNPEGWPALSLFAGGQLEDCQTLNDFFGGWLNLCESQPEKDFVLCSAALLNAAAYEKRPSVDI